MARSSTALAVTPEDKAKLERLVSSGNTEQRVEFRDDDFEKPKIVYADIAKLMRASYDVSNSYCANTMYIVPTDDLSFLGILIARYLTGIHAIHSNR